ncbi:hypothetical protein ABEF95_017223 [Exophiala dermatitidis]
MTTDEIKAYGKLVTQKRADKTKDLFHFRFWLYARVLPPALVVERLVAATPPVVQWLLGGKRLDSSLLREYAPLITDQHRRRRGCYGDFGHNVETGEDADYIGSSVDVLGRTNQHDRVIQRKAVAVEENLPKHYRVLRGRG